MITQLILHLAEQNTTSIHVRLGEKISLIASVQEAQDCNAFHQTSSGVPEELAPWLETAVDADVVLRRHVEVAGFWGVVGRLLGDVVAFCVVWEFPVAGESFAQDWVEWFLDSSVLLSV